ncbi:hypothetical protein [Luteithermobacter gelatinilyticus]|uniref:hypothetical protein n=1 Tax=Luteithermobacter gelatinilyticus TaxID=2582913 RepID=UPI001105C2D3|nr:hypothetical protein [Luteithermobacter gelatinilyticus]|tara:strand:+ start:2433 stop:2894 length:462 start_codon:yes stop_codon:yes gene_type:complete
MDLSPVNSSHVHIEWLEEKIGIVRVYDRPVNALQMAQGVPYIFFTVVQVDSDKRALFKGALKFPLRALKLIINYARAHTDWKMIWWERPSAGYNVYLDLQADEGGKYRIIKSHYKNKLDKNNLNPEQQIRTYDPDDRANESETGDFHQLALAE